MKNKKHKTKFNDPEPVHKLLIRITFDLSGNVKEILTQKGNFVPLVKCEKHHLVRLATDLKEKKEKNERETKIYNDLFAEIERRLLAGEMTIADTERQAIAKEEHYG